MRERPSLRRHFSAVAPTYRQLRELDVDAVRRVAAIIRRLARVKRSVTLVDIGSGTGRYTEAVLAAVHRLTGRSCRAVEYDASPDMLGWTPGVEPAAPAALERVVGLAEELPFADQRFDVLVSFNAVHHFGLPAFAAEAARVVRPGGRVILYTRTPEQNRQTLWGRFFPHFAEREFRLYSEGALRTKLTATGAFTAVRTATVPWTFTTSLARLLETARGGCYSTFEFYTDQEFEQALATFRQRLQACFPDPSVIPSRNEHLLVHATRGGVGDGPGKRLPNRHGRRGGGGG